MAYSRVEDSARPLLDATGEIPNIAPGSTELMMKLMDTDVGVRDVLDTVERSATVVGKLISIANSVWSNPTTAVTTLDAACTRLGLDVVRTVATAMVIGRSFNASSCPGFDRLRFWASSIITSQSAAILASEYQVDASSARAAGLLHNIGLLWLADCLPEETSSAILMADDDAVAQLDIEFGLSRYLERLCGIGYRAASLRLLSHWRLPSILMAGLGVLEDSDEQELHDNMGTVIGHSVHIASSVCAGKKTIDWDDDVDQVAVLNGIFEKQRSTLSRTLDMASELVKM